jgi:hypothetical protein
MDRAKNIKSLLVDCLWIAGKKMVCSNGRTCTVGFYSRGPTRTFHSGLFTGQPSMFRLLVMNRGLARRTETTVGEEEAIESPVDSPQSTNELFHDGARCRLPCTFSDHSPVPADAPLREAEDNPESFCYV